ncbi:MAG TPA: hypothetical protein VGH88_09905, partial [Streptosporangiaceae bacterium]
MHRSLLLSCAVAGAVFVAPGAARADGTVVVKLSRGAHLRAASSTPIPRLGLRLVRVTGSAAAAAAKLSRARGVRWAEVNGAVHA